MNGFLINGLALLFLNLISNSIQHEPVHRNVDLDSCGVTHEVDVGDSFILTNPRIITQENLVEITDIISKRLPRFRRSTPLQQGTKHFFPNRMKRLPPFSAVPKTHSAEQNAASSEGDTGISLPEYAEKQKLNHFVHRQPFPQFEHIPRLPIKINRTNTNIFKHNFRSPQNFESLKQAADRFEQSLQAKKQHVDLSKMIRPLPGLQQDGQQSQKDIVDNPPPQYPPSDVQEEEPEENKRRFQPLPALERPSLSAKRLSSFAQYRIDNSAAIKASEKADEFNNKNDKLSPHNIIKSLDPDTLKQLKELLNSQNEAPPEIKNDAKLLRTFSKQQKRYGRLRRSASSSLDESELSSEDETEEDDPTCKVAFKRGKHCEKLIVVIKDFTDETKDCSEEFLLIHSENGMKKLCGSNSEAFKPILIEGDRLTIEIYMRTPSFTSGLEFKGAVQCKK